MIDRQFKAIAFRGEGKDIEAHVVDCVLAEDCAALIQRAREEEREKAATPCVWTEDDDAVWHPACGEEHAFCFNDGGPEHNKVNFCHGCGHPIKAQHYTDEYDRAAGLREGEKL